MAVDGVRTKAGPVKILCCVVLLLTGCDMTFTSRPAAPEGMECVEAHEEVLKPNGETKVVCTRYVRTTP